MTDFDIAARRLQQDQKSAYAKSRASRVGIIYIISLVGYFVYHSYYADSVSSSMFHKKNAAESESSSITASASECNPHVVFTTFICSQTDTNEACTPLRQLIENNTQYTWSSMADVTFLNMNDESLFHIKTNKYGVPLFRDMYENVYKHCPKSRTYTYINGDLFSTYDGFIGTIKAVYPDSYSKLGEFVLVGQRTNVPWDVSLDAQTLTNETFHQLFQTGELMVPNAVDYFISTRHAFNWDDIPPFVIGRAVYDNWLIEDLLFQTPNTQLVDVTQTLPMIHQNDGGGKFSWGGERKNMDQEDIWYNDRLAREGNRRRRFAHGHTNNAEWETFFDDDNNDEQQGERRRIIRVRHNNRWVYPTNLGKLDIGPW